MSLPDKKTILKDKLYGIPNHTVPLRLFFYAAYAYRIVEKYQPKIIMTNDNGSAYSPFLRKYANDSGGVVIHVAHSVPTDNYRKFNLIDYDYYFLYGQSSYQKLSNKKTSYGQTNCVLTGPLYLNLQDTHLPPRAPNQSILLFGTGPKLEKSKHVQSLYAKIHQWATLNADYTLYIKNHPRSGENYWNTTPLPHNIIVTQKETMTTLMSKASLAISIYSNAVIDAALLNRPSIFFNTDKMNDEFEIEKFFLPRVSDPNELQHSIRTILNDYDHYLQKTREFAHYHIARKNDSVDTIASSIQLLMNDSKPDCLSLAPSTEGSIQ